MLCVRGVILKFVASHLFCVSMYQGQSLQPNCCHTEDMTPLYSHKRKLFVDNVCYTSINTIKCISTGASLSLCQVEKLLAINPDTLGANSISYTLSLRKQPIAPTNLQVGPLGTIGPGKHRFEAIVSLVDFRWGVQVETWVLSIPAVDQAVSQVGGERPFCYITTRGQVSPESFVIASNQASALSWTGI